MDKKLLLVLIFAVIGLAVLTSGCTQQSQNITQNDIVQNTTQNNTVHGNKTDRSATKDYDVTATMKGPSTPQKRGKSVTIYYTVTNKGKNNVYNVKAWSQDFDKYIGTLNPGQTKKYTYMQYIPTDKDLASWYDSSVKLTGTLSIGGIYVSFKDGKGISHRIQSNSIEIKLLN